MSSHKKKKNKTSRKSTSALPKQRFPIKWIVLIVAVVAGAAGLIVYSLRPTEPDRTASPVPRESKVESTVEFQKLIGRWLRPDGGYILEISHASSDGKMEAAYFNPRRINVLQAEVSRKTGGLEVFIELRDTGYPGSTYTLTYNPQQDMLTGIYFQATMGQSFEVIFVRAK
jgi:hypothetical protein